MTSPVSRSCARNARDPDGENAERERLAREPALAWEQRPIHAARVAWSGRGRYAELLPALLLRMRVDERAPAAARSLPDARRGSRPRRARPPARRFRAARSCRGRRRSRRSSGLRFGSIDSLSSGVHDIAAVRMQHLPAHVGGVLAGEEHVAGRHFVRLAGALHRRAFAVLGESSRRRTTTGSAASRSAPARRRSRGCPSRPAPATASA